MGGNAYLKFNHYIKLSLHVALSFPGGGGVREGKGKVINKTRVDEILLVIICYLLLNSGYHCCNSFLVILFSYFLPLLWCHNSTHNLAWHEGPIAKSFFLFPSFYSKHLFLYLISPLMMGSSPFADLTHCLFLFCSFQ